MVGVKETDQYFGCLSTICFANLLAAKKDNYWGFSLRVTRVNESVVSEQIMPQIRLHGTDFWSSNANSDKNG